MVRTRTPSGSSEINIPQVEVILTHSLVCRKTRREFIVGSDPDASFVANLAKHIRQMQPGTQMAKANSLLCIFCNSPYTYEDYLRHIQPSMDTILVSCNLISPFFLTARPTIAVHRITSLHPCFQNLDVGILNDKKFFFFPTKGHPR